MKKGLWQKLLLVMVAVALIAAAFPVVSAFESHTIDIRVHETIPATKMARLATPEEINLAKENGAGIPVAANPDNLTWDVIPVNTCIVWVVSIFVNNPLDYTMNNVTVYDEFNDNVAVASLGASQGSVAIILPNVLNTWDIGSLDPGDSACLNLIVWTRSADDVQQFSSPGTYDLNAYGIVMNWSYLNAQNQWIQDSYQGGPSLTVTVYQP